MISTPVILFPFRLNLTPPAASINPTIGAGTARGGYGELGTGWLYKGAALVGPGDASTNPLPVVAGAALKGGTVGAAYTETLTAQGGTAPYTFTATSGTPPSGTSLNPSTGVISGTPTTATSYTFVIQATDANSLIGPTQSFTIVIAAPAAVSSPNSGFSY